MNENAQSGFDTAEHLQFASEEDLLDWLDQAIETTGLPLETTVDVLGIKFTFEALDHGNTTSVSQACREWVGDIFTRDLEWSKRILARALKKVNGKPVEAKVAFSFIDRLPVSIVQALYRRFENLRRMQENTVQAFEDEIKKKQGAGLSGLGGGSQNT